MLAPGLSEALADHARAPLRGCQGLDVQRAAFPELLEAQRHHVAELAAAPGPVAQPEAQLIALGEWITGGQHADAQAVQAGAVHLGINKNSSRFSYYIIYICNVICQSYILIILYIIYSFLIYYVYAYGLISARVVVHIL